MPRVSRRRRRGWKLRRPSRCALLALRLTRDAAGARLHTRRLDVAVPRLEGERARQRRRAHRHRDRRAGSRYAAPRGRALVARRGRSHTPAPGVAVRLHRGRAAHARALDGRVCDRRRRIHPHGRRPRRDSLVRSTSGRSRVHRCRSRRISRDSSRPATCAAHRSSVVPPRSARDQWPLRCSTAASRSSVPSDRRKVEDGGPTEDAVAEFGSGWHPTSKSMRQLPPWNATG